MEASDLKEVMEKINNIKAKRSRLEGAIDQTLAQLQDFGCDDVEQAKKMLDKLKDSVAVDEIKFTELLKQIEDIVKDWENI